MGGSTEAIADLAGVSPRTIYNHFPSKDALFAYVLEESATQVSEAFVAKLNAIRSNDVTEELVAIGIVLATLPTEFPEHFTMVWMIEPVTLPVPAEVVDAWWDVGPHKVEKALAERLEELDRAGRVHVEDPLAAAGHFRALATLQIYRRAWYTAAPIAHDEIERLVRSSVRAFLEGYGL